MFSRGGSCAPRITQAARSCSCSRAIISVVNAQCASTLSVAPSRTSKSGPMLVCFVHFEIEMCFAPQRCALFRHLNFQKWSEREVFLAFSLANVLRASSRNNGVHFSISHLARRLRTRRFSEPTFRPSGATNHWKNTVFRDFPTFSRTWIFFLLILSPF